MLTHKSSTSARFWACALLSGLFLTIFALYPQIKLWTADEDWQGHYAYNDIDEVAYAAYLKALIDGRPRRNDPYSGEDDTNEKPQPESLFSIQFAAPYMIALPARLFAISAPSAMTLTGAVAGFMAAIFSFWLFYEVSESALYSCAGSLFVLCGGALFAGEGAIGEILGTGFPYPYFPFLRRYVPAVPFPVFLFLLVAVWKMLAAEDRRYRVIWCITASVCFSFLVFSYFYIWTAAAACLGCILIGLFVVRPDDWKRKATGMAILGTCCAFPMAAYAYMLSNRATSMDKVQLLVNTHLPDFGRTPLFLGLGAIAIAILTTRFGYARWRSVNFIFAISTGIVPFLLFNQQVITGKSLQPIHYQVFIGNYIAGLSIVFAVGLFLCNTRNGNSRLVKGFLAAIVALSIVWGFVECHFTVRVLNGANLIRDRGVEIGKVLENEGRDSNDPFRETALSFSTIQSDDLPTLAPQNVLWARHQHVFAGLTWEENKKRYFKQLYYQDLTPEWLDRQLRSGNFVASIALFGWGRHSGRLTTESSPLTSQEIEKEVALFRTFSDSFDLGEAKDPAIKYFIVSTENEGRFSNLERWYEKKLVRQVAGFRIYRLNLR